MTSGRPERMRWQPTSTVKETDQRRWLLRTRRERPGRRAAEKRDELALVQLIELHMLPLAGRRQHSGLARIGSGACCSAGIQAGI